MDSGITAVLRSLSRTGIRVSSYTTGELAVAPVPGCETTAIDDIRRGLDEAAELGAKAVIVRAGGLPRGSRNVEGARRGVAEAMAALEPYAASVGVPLALEPLHPMFASDRGVVVTLDNALEIVEPIQSTYLGVALDLYNSWWDPQLLRAISRAGDRIKVVQLADWKVPLEVNPVYSRVMIGDGSIDYGPIFGALREAGYTGDIEVEIFNQLLWATQARKVVALVNSRFQEHISPLL